MSHTTIPSSVVSPLPVDAEHHYIRAMVAMLGLLVVIAFGLITFAIVHNDATPARVPTVSHLAPTWWNVPQCPRIGRC